MRLFAKTSLLIACTLWGCSDSSQRLDDEDFDPATLATAVPIAASQNARAKVGKASSSAPQPSQKLERIDSQLQEPSAKEGQSLGKFKLTYYWVAQEGNGRKNTTIRDKRYKPIAKVTRKFARRLRLEGSGQLRDGRLVTTAGGCKCGSACYWVAKDKKYRFGAGVSHRPLSPFRSIAVDTKLVSIGQTLYVPELDGLTMPGPAPYGGFVHDGCLIADDRGGGVRGRKIDFFAARKSHYRSLFKRHGIKRITAFDGGNRCKGLKEGKATPALAASRGSI
jgi:3D (Asp-Asp-Asp) domain-containing protein